MYSTFEFDVVTGDGSRLRARRVGQGPPLVFVHGSAGGLSSWDPLVPHLVDEFSCWTFARRGYAPSTLPARPKSFADDVADLLAVIARIGAESSLAPVVVGGSYGAWVCLLLAAQLPDAVHGVVAFEPPLFAVGGAQDAIPMYRRLMEDRRLNAAARLFAERVARAPAELLDTLGLTGDEPGDADPPEMAAAADEATGSLHDLEAMAGYIPWSKGWSTLTTPVLLLQGERTWDPMPATMDDLAAQLPTAVVAREKLAGQTHFAVQTAPAAFAQAVSRFSRTIGSAPTRIGVTEGKTARDAAARIWATATAYRDASPNVATLAQARPVIDSVLDTPGSLLVAAWNARRQIEGFAALAPIGEASAEVHYLAVDPKAWRRGVGRRLLCALPTLADSRGLRALELSVYADNTAAVTAYERAGWLSTGTETRHPRTGRVERRYRLSWS